MEIPILSEEEFSERYIDPFAKSVVRLAAMGDGEANDTLEAFTGIRLDPKPAASTCPEVLESEPDRNP